jgi:membrane protein implicated in regulation of membrane protease activity
MYLVAIAWMYVVVMMAIVEAGSANGSVLGALVTLLLYGALPLSIVLYLMATPARRRARQAAERSNDAATSSEPDRGGQAPGDPVATVRKEP